jgi:hypothetical protein
MQLALEGQAPANSGDACIEAGASERSMHRNPCLEKYPAAVIVSRKTS